MRSIRVLKWVAARRGKRMARNGRNGDLTRAIGAKALETERMAHKMLERNGNGNGNGRENGNGNGNGYGRGQGNTTYGASTFGVAGRNGRDNMTMKELVAMPKGKKT